MKTRLDHDSVWAYLRSAQPRLICRVGSPPKCYIRQGQCVGEKVLSEGYDPHTSPLGPVHWRIVDSADERLYCSTFLAKRSTIIKGWGSSGLVYLDPAMGAAAARNETLILAGELPKYGEYPMNERLSRIAEAYDVILAGREPKSVSAAEIMPAIISAAPDASTQEITAAVRRRINQLAKGAVKLPH